jgi:hypothetical protein
MEPQQPRAAHRQHGPDGAATFGERIDRMSDTAHQAWDRTRHAFDDIKETMDIQGRVSRHPYGTLAAALGIGYVLGGGLFSRLTGRILGLGLRLGIRLAALPLIKDELLGFAEALGTGGPRAERGEETRPSNTNKEREP